MRTATGLALLAAGAILTFAVNARVPGINLQLAGLIIMATGVAGLIVPSQVAAWLRHRDVVHGDLRDPAADESDQFAYPTYLMQDPAVLAAEVLNGARATEAGRPEAARSETARSETARSETARSETARSETARSRTLRVAGQRAPDGTEQDGQNREV